jgi:hypothetical protein
MRSSGDPFVFSWAFGPKLKQIPSRRRVALKGYKEFAAQNPLRLDCVVDVSSFRRRQPISVK